MIHMARNKVILISNHREAECFVSPRQAVPPRGGAVFKPSGWSAGGDVKKGGNEGVVRLPRQSAVEPKEHEPNEFNDGDDEGDDGKE